MIKIILIALLQVLSELDSEFTITEAYTPEIDKEEFPDDKRP